MAPSARAQPQHWGGVLHGYVERAVMEHAPHALPLLRPDGMDDFSCMALEVPPFETAITDRLRFGIVLFGHATQAWALLLRALLQQSTNGLNGRGWKLQASLLLQPGSPTLAVVQDGRLTDPLPQPEDPGAWVRRTKQPDPSSDFCLHTLHLRSPLLLGGRSRIRREQSPAWPSLGSMLQSIARRALALEPELARSIGLHTDWQAPAPLTQLQPLTLPGQPARAVRWLYDPRRSIVKPGLVGPLIYPARLDLICQRLLHWGQWLGVGQQTTMGCGRYVWQVQSAGFDTTTISSSGETEAESHETSSS